ncbi:MAG: hypothetical protein LBC31_08745 [Treponema sp.]|jgi:hypothetical protein|nr:hypothetical protein [Treponema sp.]
MDVTITGDRGVLLPDHPPVIDSVLIAAGKTYQAGTLLKYAAGGAVASADATTGGSATPADQVDVVLLEDIDTTVAAKPARVLLHGLVVRARLLKGTGASPVAASDAMVDTLKNRGIYALQSWDRSVVV